MRYYVDRRGYLVPTTTDFTYEEFMEIKNTPPSDHTFMREESARIMAKLHEAKERERARAREEAARQQEEQAVAQ